MTRPAESLTVQIRGEEGLWAPQALAVAERERRPVLPSDFAKWFADQWSATEAGWLARKLRISRWPMAISTAVSIVVRLELCDGQLFRKWVAFSAAEREYLEGRGLEGAELNASLSEAARFVFEAADPALIVDGPLSLWACEELHPLHAYRIRAAGKPRVVDLSRRAV